MLVDVTNLAPSSPGHGRNDTLEFPGSLKSADLACKFHGMISKPGAKTLAWPRGFWGGSAGEGGRGGGGGGSMLFYVGGPGGPMDLV